MSWLLTILLKPFLLFCYFGFVAFCNWLVDKLLPDCKLKRILLKHY